MGQVSASPIKVVMYVAGQCLGAYHVLSFFFSSFLMGQGGLVDVTVCLWVCLMHDATQMRKVKQPCDHCLADEPHPGASIAASSRQLFVQVRRHAQFLLAAVPSLNIPTRDASLTLHFKLQ
jgi:hypothetical protein